MSDDMYEVAFSGEILADANIEQVKQAVASLFKADEKKLAQLFSGKRMVIKKNISLAVAQKYQSALTKAQAVCEIKNLSAEDLVEPPKISPPIVETSPTTAQAQTPATASAADGNVAALPDFNPLHINADNIADLDVTIAPVGSDLQDEIKEVTFEFNEDELQRLSIAPVGSDLSDKKHEVLKPDLDISGLSLK